jgi:BirA family biotin operon repressor/biotin-[acetyl-CoA-carboxylase] ligase
MIRDIWEFPDRTVGRRVVVYAMTDSTNSRAAEHAGQPGLAFLADEQTAGRGQHGRTWTARPRSSVLLSLLLAPPAALARPAILTAWAAVSVCETVRRLTGVQTRIKWPNDVLLKRRKVAGILIEQCRPGEVVAGIGLNVRQSREEFDAAGLLFATSLLAAGVEKDTEEVARLLLGVLEEEYARLLGGDLVTLEACWKWHLALLGKPVEVECADRHHRGRLMDVGFGGVRLRRERGAELIVPPEAVLHLTALSSDDDAAG